MHQNRLIEEFTLLNFQFTDAYVAMLDSVDEPGTIVAVPLDAIGVARVKRCWLEPGQRLSDMTREDFDIERRMVALILEPDGRFEILNEATNFLGICRKGKESEFTPPRRLNRAAE